MASSQSEDYDRLVPPQLMDEVKTTAHTQPALPPEAVLIMNHRFDHSIGQWVAELPHFLQTAFDNETAFLSTSIPQ